MSVSHMRSKQASDVVTSAVRSVGIISIGDMGLGIARLLQANDYKVATYAADRSELTQSRATAHGIALLPSIDELVHQCDCILSIVPPRDAVMTAQRFGNTQSLQLRKSTLYYLDLNATAPSTAREIDSFFAEKEQVCFMDGGIIGGPPRPPTEDSDRPDSGSTWDCPSIVVSGPGKLPDPRLSNILNIVHLDGPIGMATGLKMCFASISKGLSALAIQSYTTAHRLGVLDELRAMMSKHNPAALSLCDRGVTGMPPKAYRWVYEMQEIATTMANDGGFERDIFDGVSAVYQAVADDDVLGQEKQGTRNRGTTVEDVVELIGAGMESKE